jgi:hydrogenase 3 maturation protease
MPLSFMIKYLESFTDAKLLLIGIQPKNMEMSIPVSEEVKTGVVELTRIINNSFNVQIL